MHCACLCMLDIRLKTSLNNDVSVITHTNIDSKHSSTKDGWIYVGPTGERRAESSRSNFSVAENFRKRLIWWRNKKSVRR